jgi:hypothetical protein
MSRRLLLQLLHQKRPLQPHPYNTPFRPFDFDGQRIILRLDIVDLALEVLAFRAVPRVFSPRIRRMMSPRFLLSASANKEPSRHAGVTIKCNRTRDTGKGTAKFGCVGDGAAILGVRASMKAAVKKRIRGPWPGGTRISFD